MPTLWSESSHLAKRSGQVAPGMSWSTVVASLRRYGGTVPRAQGQLCCQHYGSGLDPIIRGSSATAYGARVLRRTRVEAPRGFRGGLTVRWPGRYCRSVVQGTGTADAMVVKGSVAHRKCKRRDELLAGLDVYASSHPHLKAITGTRGSVLSLSLIHI